jgi:hypothetical protein
MTHNLNSILGWSYDQKSRTSIDKNIQKKLLLKTRLPLNPDHNPPSPWTRTICRAQSMGPLNCRSFISLCDWSWSFTVMQIDHEVSATSLKKKASGPLSSSIGVAITALQGKRVSCDAN